MAETCGVPVCGCWLLLPWWLSFFPTRKGRILSASSTLRPLSPLSPRQGLFAVCVQPGLHSAHLPRAGIRTAGCGDQIKGKKQGFTAFFYLNVYYCFALLFQAVVSKGPFFLCSKARSLFLFEGQKGCEEITWLLKGWSGLSVYLKAPGDKLFHGLHITWQLITSWRGERQKCQRSSTGCCYRRSFVGRVQISCIARMPWCLRSAWRQGLNPPRVLASAWTRKVDVA